MKKYIPYFLLFPAIIAISLIIVYPIVLSLDISFQDIKIAKLSSPRKEWTIINYKKLFYSHEFWYACFTTIKLILIVTSVCFILGLTTALLVNRKFYGRKLARLLVALPWAVPEIIASTIWMWLFDSTSGLLNWILIKIDFLDKPLNWFSNPTAAFSTVCAVMVWKGYPFISIMLLAGLQSVPKDLYEASKVDGAKKYQQFIFITIPSISPIIGVSLILLVLWVFRDFTIITLLTEGGPIGSTRTLAILTYETAFSYYKMGYGAAIGIVTLLFCLIVSIFMIKKTNTQIF